MLSTAKVLNKLYAEYEARRLEKANQFLTENLAISTFADLLGGLDAIESSTELDKELQKDWMLSDIESIVKQMTPAYLPFLGILSGGITTGKHVFSRHMNKGPSNIPEQDSG